MNEQILKIKTGYSERKGIPNFFPVREDVSQFVDLGLRLEVKLS